jgi:NitT/TauT family transport system substrate-binding protein
MAFCEVVGRDPFFLIGRESNPNFSFRHLLDCRLAVVTEVPAPWMCLQYDLRLSGIDPASIRLSTPMTMPKNMEAFRAGQVDVVQLFHPFALELVTEGQGHIWYAAANRGPACYTTLNTTREFAERSGITLLKICRAMYRCQNWIAEHSADDIARVVASFFPSLALKTLASCIQHYKALGIWSVSPLISRAGFDWIRDAGLSNGRVPQRYSYEDCVDIRFAKQAVLEIS